MELTGKTVAITGASRGIGAGLATEFAARGMKLALCARSPCALPAGAEGVTGQVDVANEHDVRRFASEAEAALGTIDLWINNAGVLTPIAPLRDVAAEEFLASLRVNVMGVVHGCQAFIRHLRAHDHKGVLINISSGASTSPYAGWAAYCAGKAAVDLLSGVIGLEEREHLRVYSVAPGIIDTNMQTMIRDLSPDVFPMVDKFKEFKANDAYNTMSFVADHILRYAFDPDSTPDQVTVRIPLQFPM